MEEPWRRSRTSRASTQERLEAEGKLGQDERYIRRGEQRRGMNVPERIGGNERGGRR
jgi:hypothetical protein